MQIDDAQVDVSRLIVLAAQPEEMAAHEAVLDAIEKETKKTALWRAVSAARDDAA